MNDQVLCTFLKDVLPYSAGEAASFPADKAEAWQAKGWVVCAPKSASAQEADPSPPGSGPPPPAGGEESGPGEAGGATPPAPQATPATEASGSTAAPPVAAPTRRPSTPVTAKK